MRTNKTLALSQLLPGLPLLNGGKTCAAWPVWSDSVREEVRFAPISKKQATRLYHKARAWNRLKAARRYGGAIGSAAMRVLESLIFDFLNYPSGRLDPSYDSIARKTGLGRSTVAVALARLKELRIINWLRRCAEDRDEAGRFVLRQQTNAYAVLSASQWLNYVAPEPPHPTAWGAVPPLPPLMEQAVVVRRNGGGVNAMVTVLDADPDDPLAAALASLGRALCHDPQQQSFSGVRISD